MDEKLLELGFYEYRPNKFDGDGVEKCFQKRYDDEKGKKYFISIKKWKPLTHPYTKEITPAVYEYDIQLYKKEDHDAINLLFHSSWKLEEVEEYMEKLWNTNLFDYYEEF